MATPVVMPRQGQSVETCIITQWNKKKGEAVKAGDILFSYETDKASFDAEVPEDGILLEIFFSEGDEVPVLTNVAVIGKAGEDTEIFKSNAVSDTDSDSDSDSDSNADAGSAGFSKKAVAQDTVAVSAADSGTVSDERMRGLAIKLSAP